jgi:TPR repeat protein
LAAVFALPGCGKKKTEDPSEASRHKPDAADGSCSPSCSSADACYAAGYDHLYGEEEGGGQAAAAPCFRQACELGHADACRGLAGMFDFGQGLDPNPDRAGEFWARAAQLHKTGCDDGGMRDCFELGILMFRGQGIAQDQAAAASLYKQACDGGNANGCVELKLICAGGSFPACF